MKASSDSGFSWPATQAWFWRNYAPKLLNCLRDHYSLRHFRKDLLAGVTVGAVALPLAMAFAIASGVSPERGLFTAIIGGFLISALSGSRFQIGGPTGAFVVIIYSVVEKHGYDGLVLATLMAGFFLLLAAFSGLGALIQYIPYPVTTGFTTGIAVIIFSSQIKDFFGLAMEQPPADFIPKWMAYANAASGFNLTALGVGAGSLAALILLRRRFPHFPGPIFVLGAAAAIVHFFGLPVETIGSRFGGIPNMLPSPHLPEFTWMQAREIAPEALTIALLAAIESLLSAVVADGMTGDQHKPGAELLSQGIANIASVCFGGIPATGAIARTATNIRAGAKTPVSGIIHAGTLLVFMVLAAPVAKAIPLAALAALLILVAYNMSELEKFLHLFDAPRSDVAVLLTTFLLTVLVDLTVAVEVGVLLAALLFMRRMIEVTSIDPLAWEQEAERSLSADPEGSDPDATGARVVPKGVEIFEINGPFFFGVADRLKSVLDTFESPPKVFILRMRHVPAVDASGLYALEVFYSRCRKRHTTMVLSGVQNQPLEAIQKAGLDQLVGPENIHPSIDAALARAQEILAALPA
jgi:sulfate permease, SulP family